MLLHLELTSYLAVALAVLLGASGLPLPLNVMLAAAATVARHGHLSLPLLFLCSVAAAVAGDNLGYAVGRVVLRRVSAPRWLQKRLRPGMAEVLNPRRFALLIFFTRWAVTIPATPVNLLAGARSFSWPLFLLVDLVGEAIWVLLSLLPGFVLGDTWVLGVAAAVALSIAVAAAASFVMPLLRISAKPGTLPIAH